MNNGRCPVVESLCVAFFCVLSVAWLGSECEASEWVWANPRPTGNQMSATAHCGNTFVAVGGFGEIFSSADGIHWIQRSSGTNENFHDVACNGTIFVAVGGGGTVLTSIDGVLWDSIDIGLDSELHGIGWFDQFVVVGVGPVIATSDDGLSWSIRHSDDFNQYLWDVASNGSLLVATGGDWETDDTSLVMSSSDLGLTWTKSTIDSYYGYGYLNGVTWGDDLFVAVHDEGTTFSSNGVDPWTVSEIVPEYSLVGITWDGDQFVAVGSSGVITTSSDANTWEVRAFVPCGLLYGIEWTGEQYLAAGYSGVVASSEDTASWELRLPTDGVTNVTFEDIAWNGSTFVACGFKLGPSEGVFATSSNGWDWSATSVTDIRRPTGVAWGDGVFAAVTRFSNLIKTSPDGVSWVSHPLPGFFSLHDVVWSAAKSEFVAVGSSGKILTSPDGAVWSERVSGTTNLLVSVDCDDTRCVAVSTHGTVTMSVDNVTWNTQSITSERLYGIAHNSSRFVAVGTAGTVMTSSDGTVWEPENPGTSLSFGDVAWVGDEFVATAAGGAVFSSIAGETWSGGQVAALRTSLLGVCNDYPLIVGRNSAVMVRCDTSPDSDGDGAGDLCDPCPSDPDDGCDQSGSTSSIIGPEGGSVTNAGGRRGFNSLRGLLATTLWCRSRAMIRRPPTRALWLEMVWCRPATFTTSSRRWTSRQMSQSR